MSKIEIYCKVRKKNIKVEKRLGDALVKMKRAEYLTQNVKPEQYETKVMTASDTGIPATEEIHGLELDASGEPYNPEIHTATKSKTKDGNWKKKRGSKGE